MTSKAPFALAATAAFVPVLACKSVDELRDDANREAYAIVSEYRERLGTEDDFTIVPPSDSLRERILAGDTDVPPLSLTDCLRVAAENSREYRNRRDSLYLEALDLTLARFDFSWVPDAGGGSTVTGDFNEAQSASFFSDLAVTRAFQNGARFFGSISLDLARSLATGDPWDAISNFTLDITQPLLRGFGDDIVREPLTQAERNVLYEARSYERFRRTFAFDVASRYYRIIAQRETLSNERRNLESLIALRERNEALAEAGRLSDIQVDQARQNELRAQDSVVAAVANLQTQFDNFKFFLGLPIDAEIDLGETGADELGLLQLVEDNQDVIDGELALLVAERERLDYHTVLDRIIDATRAVNIAANALETRLDLTGSLNGTSRNDEPLTFASDGANWSLGAVLDLPIAQLPERNVHRATEINLRASRRRAVDFHDDMFADVRLALRNLAEQRARLSIQRGAVELARRRVESSELNLQAGRASTRDVLEAQDSKIQAENQAAQAEADYVLAGLALFRDMGLIRIDENGLGVATDALTVEDLPAQG